ncbi:MULTISPECIES: hypothetical protein [unclassified Myroides]|uniref:hypothetical protein n=1 Tax=unclassified Myroides TaxID=2642485 RepID=UPI003D2F63B1
MSRSLALLTLLLCLFVSAVQAQEQGEIDDCVDCPTAEEADTPAPVVSLVAADSLYRLNDKEGTVYNKKFQTDFKQQYKGKEDFTYEKTDPKVSAWEQIKQSISDWFTRNFTRKAGEELSNYYYVVILRILGFTLLGVIIFYLVRAFIQNDMYWLVKKKAKKINAFEDLSTEDFRSTNFESLIAESTAAQNYRLAIRLYYLWLLQRLQEENKITWAPEKTNADYNYELQESWEREQFTYLSYLYNNIWYGEHEIAEADFFKAKKSFDTKLKSNKP